MFTGLITDIGIIKAVEQTGDTRFRIVTSYDPATIDIGASIACDGICLTVVEKGDDWFAVTVSAETRSKTALAGWRVGSRLNLERSLKVGDELGGHIVTGHVDGTAEIRKIAPEGDSLRLTFSLAPALAPYVAPKGAIALNGISLTVNEVRDDEFGVNIIPHTREMTTFDHAKVGDVVNVEIDILARYTARLLETMSE